MKLRKVKWDKVNIDSFDIVFNQVMASSYRGRIRGERKKIINVRKMTEISEAKKQEEGEREVTDVYQL